MGEEVNCGVDKKGKKIQFLIWTIAGIIILGAFALATTTSTENYISTTGNGTFLGSLGIGTSTPSQTLDVRGQGNFSGIIWYNNNTAITLLNDTLLILSVNTTNNIQQLLNSTGVYSIPLTINTTANIWNLITGIFTNVAWKNQTQIFTENQNFSKNITVQGNILVNENITLQSGGNIDIWFN